MPVRRLGSTLFSDCMHDLWFLSYHFDGYHQQDIHVDSGKLTLWAWILTEAENSISALILSEIDAFPESYVVMVQRPRSLNLSW